MARGDSPASGLTKAEQLARDRELAEIRSKTVRRIIAIVCVIGVPLYVWAALVISSHHR